MPDTKPQLSERHEEGYLGEKDDDTDDLTYPGSLLDDLEKLRTEAVAVVALEPNRANRDAMAAFSEIFGDGKEEKRERFAGFDRNSSDGYGSWR